MSSYRTNLCDSYCPPTNYKERQAALQRLKDSRIKRQKERELFEQRKLSQSISSNSRARDTSGSCSNSSSLRTPSVTSSSYHTSPSSSSSRPNESRSDQGTITVSQFTKPSPQLQTELRPKDSTTHRPPLRHPTEKVPLPQTRQSLDEKLRRYERQKRNFESILREHHQHFKEYEARHGLKEALRRLDRVAQIVGMWDGRIRELQS